MPRTTNLPKGIHFRDGGFWIDELSDPDYYGFIDLMCEGVICQVCGQPLKVKNYSRGILEVGVCSKCDTPHRVMTGSGCFVMNTAPEIILPNRSFLEVLRVYWKETSLPNGLGAWSTRGECMDPYLSAFVRWQTVNFPTGEVYPEETLKRILDELDYELH